MKRPWNRRAPYDPEQALREVLAEARHLGVIVGEEFLPKDLQDRVRVARADRRNAILNWAQSIGIIRTTLIITLALHRSDQRSQRLERQAEADQRSAEMMLKFADKLSSGPSAQIEMPLQLNGNLSKQKVSDEQLDEFLGNYELLDDAYRYGLINEDMAYNAFSFDLDKAAPAGQAGTGVYYHVEARRDRGGRYDGDAAPCGVAWISIRVSFSKLLHLPERQYRPAGGAQNAREWRIRSPARLFLAAPASRVPLFRSS